MLTNLTLKNFQAHKQLSVDFAKTVTTIVGPSDKGKSSVIRALQLIVQNKPAGESFIRYGTDRTIVKLECDGQKIIRIRGRGKNIYKLNDEKYAAFGNDVPETISALCNISDMNFQTQHSAPFWFCETAGEVSRQLNNIVNLDIIDSTLFNIVSDIRKQRSTTELIERRLLRITSQQNLLEYIKTMDEELSTTELLEQQHKKTSCNRATIDDLLTRVSKYRAQKKAALQLVSLGQDALNKEKIQTNKQTKLDELTTIINQINKYQKAIQIRPPSIKPLQTLYNNINNINANIKSLQNNMTQIQITQDTIIEEKRTTKNLQKEFKQTIGDVCPLCNQPIR